ncbi:IucA/IucC family protein [Paenibacillus campi]|uniref:IucA/IucC family protein n=1 Tax=Paenibacillus campi TaxID=3106031 RepID=UPI002AFDDF47|nr:IucA/IucC family protein [Paenibacillus sp. SGZ-1014]
MLNTIGLKTGNSQQPDCMLHAERHACKLLLNCYIRELGAERPAQIRLDRQHGSIKIDFPASGKQMQAQLAYYSATGEHEYRSFSWGTASPVTASGSPYKQGQHAAQQGTYEQTCADHLLLLEAIIAELHDGTQLTTERAQQFRQRVDNSVHNTGLYMEYARRSGKPLTDYRSSEQALLVGHPFHPFPKSTLGFSAEDVLKYSPELGSAFALCYVAVSTDVYSQDWAVDHHRQQIMTQLRQQLLSTEKGAQDRLLTKWLHEEQYELLPMHPWQYGYIQTLPVIRQYIEQRKLILLEQCGPLAYPTSSVRTVFLPELNCNIKLPLHIQITNLLRINSAEQMQRTLAATRYVLEQQCFADEPYTHIACEVGTATCRFDSDEWTSLFTVAYRPIEFDPSCTYVLSALVESVQPGGKSRLYEWLESIAETGIEAGVPIRVIAEQWLHRYLERSLLPIMRAGERLGIHFEAHLQNTLVTLKDGMPEHFIIRDLEGVSVERRMQLPEVGDDILFYAEQAARARTAYYFIVNHLGSLLHVLARDTECAEQHYWQIAKSLLQQELERTNSQLIRELLAADGFNAKQNLRSCLHGHGDTPDYVQVRNMLNVKGE